MVKTFPLDAAPFLAANPDEQISLLNDALASGDPAFITSSLKLISRAQGMTVLAKETGLTRMGLYKALGKTGDPKLTTLLALASAMGMRFSVERIA